MPESAVGMSAAELAARVRSAVARVRDPEIRLGLGELNMIADVRSDDAGRVAVEVRLTIVGCPASAAIERDVTAAALAVPGVAAAAVTLSVMTAEQRAALTERLRAGRPARENPFDERSLTRVYAITSGKGGVGKSSITANLAVALAARGLEVGLIDADVHGFSIPGLLGLTERVTGDGGAELVRAVRPTRVNDMILPPVAFGVKAVSIGMFVDSPSAAVAWRGPMLHRTITQFLTDVYFGDIDVLLVDLPPGTGDVAISIGQLLPTAEVIVVTTPQAAAAEVAIRSGVVARQTGQSVFGVIENMAGVVAQDGSLVELFGSGGGEAVARGLSQTDTSTATGSGSVELLASVPLSVPLRIGGDTGVPVVVGAPSDPAAQAIERVAHRIATRGRALAGRQLDVRVTGTGPADAAASAQ